jgi:hypothetical protein
VVLRKAFASGIRKITPIILPGKESETELHKTISAGLFLEFLKMSSTSEI